MACKYPEILLECVVVCVFIRSYEDEMPKARTGGIKQLDDGTFQVRVSYTGTDGKRHERLRKNIATKSVARRVLREFLDGLEDRGEKAVEGDKLTFARLTNLFTAQHAFDAQYVNQRKVAGLRSLAPVRTYLKVLNGHFSNVLVKDISPGDIHQFKLRRLRTETVRGKQRSISAVNRELALLRRMFNFALEHRWIKANPFSNTKLILSSDEKPRDRVLSFEEEFRLLGACEAIERSHLRPLIITALDTACRRGELLKLRWRNVDFTNELISLVAFNTKTAEARDVAMTPRVKHELFKLWQTSQGNQDALVFGIQSSIKRSWKTACVLAGIEDLRFHDLRHTAVTRLVATGLPSAEIMRLSGHKQSNTFLRYVNPKGDALRRAAAALATYNEKKNYDLVEISTSNQ